MTSSLYTDLFFVHLVYNRYIRDMQEKKRNDCACADDTRYRRVDIYIYIGSYSHNQPTQKNIESIFSKYHGRSCIARRREKRKTLCYFYSNTISDLIRSKVGGAFLVNWIFICLFIDSNNLVLPSIDSRN